MTRTRVEIDLYLCDSTSSRSGATMRNLAKLCRERYGGDFSVNVIDVLEAPDVADQCNVIATPTIIVRRPLPGCRMVGDLTGPSMDLGWPA